MKKIFLLLSMVITNGTIINMQENRPINKNMLSYEQKQFIREETLRDGEIFFYSKYNCFGRRKKFYLNGNSFICKMTDRNFKKIAYLRGKNIEYEVSTYLNCLRDKKIEHEIATYLSNWYHQNTQ